jgi:hypothetical protein
MPHGHGLASDCELKGAQSVRVVRERQVARLEREGVRTDGWQVGLWPGWRLQQRPLLKPEPVQQARPAAPGRVNSKLPSRSQGRHRYLGLIPIPDGHEELHRIRFGRAIRIIENLADAALIGFQPEMQPQQLPGRVIPRRAG